MYWPHTDKPSHNASSKMDFSGSFPTPHKHTVHLILILSDRSAAYVQASHPLMSKTKCAFRRLAQKGEEVSLMHDLDQNWVGHSGSPCI